MLGFNGGLLGARKVPTTGSASGLWAPNEQSVAQRAGIWPETPGSGNRYWRFDQFTHVGDVLEIGEFVLTFNGSPLTSGTWNTVDGIVPAMNDGVYTSRAKQMASPPPEWFFTYDHVTSIAATGFRYANYYQPATRYITGVRVSVSNDGTNFTTLKTFSGLTAYTSNNGSSVNELSPEYLFL